MNANLKIKTTVVALAGAAAIAGLGALGAGTAAADVPHAGNYTLAIGGQSLPVTAHEGPGEITRLVVVSGPSKGAVYSAVESAPVGPGEIDAYGAGLHIGPAGPWTGGPTIRRETVLHPVGGGAWRGEDRIANIVIPGTSASLTPR